MSENNTDLNEVFEEEMDDADVITVPIDETLSNSGEAADAAAVGAALALKADKDELPATIKVNNQSADNQGLILIDGTDIPVSDQDTTTLAEAVEELSGKTAETIPMTGETGSETIGAAIGGIRESVGQITENMYADKIPMFNGTEANTISEAISGIREDVEDIEEAIEGMEEKTAANIPMEAGSTTMVKNAIETLDQKTVKSVNRKLPDANGDVDLSVVTLAENLQSDKLQAIEGEFMLRTTGGNGAVADGKAYPQHIYGNTRHDGFVEEELNLTVIPITRTEPDEPITAEIDRDTFIAAVTESSTINLYYTTEWSEDPEDYGVTVTGDPVAGDQITIVYVKEVRGTILVADPDRLVGTGWNLFNANAGYARVVKYSETYGYKIGGTYTSIAFSATLTGDRTSLLPNANGLFNVPSNGYVFVTGGNTTDTYILATWSDWTEGPSTGYWEAYRESGIDLAAVVETYFPYGMLKIGTARDEIDLVAKRSISRIDRMVYSEENRATAEASGQPYDFDESNIYIVRTEPVISAISIGTEYSVSEHGMEWFTETVLPLDTEILYGKNLRDKLERDVLTISQQTLTEEEKAQVRTNIGAMSQAEGDTKLVAPTEAGTAGQLLHLKEDGGTEWTTQGTPSDTQVGTAVSAWLTAHPEATTTVEDGAISRAKLNDDLKEKTDAVPDLKSALSYAEANKLDKKGKGTTSSYLTLEKSKAWNPSTGAIESGSSYKNRACIATPMPVNFPKSKLVCASGYSIFVYGNKFGSIPLTSIGSWTNEFNIYNNYNTYDKLYIVLKKNDDADLTNVDLSSVLSLVSFTGFHDYQTVDDAISAEDTVNNNKANRKGSGSTSEYLTLQKSSAWNPSTGTIATGSDQKARAVVATPIIPGYPQNKIVASAGFKVTVYGNKRGTLPLTVLQTWANEFNIQPIYGEYDKIYLQLKNDSGSDLTEVDLSSALELVSYQNGAEFVTLEEVNELKLDGRYTADSPTTEIYENLVHGAFNPSNGNIETGSSYNNRAACAPFLKQRNLYKLTSGEGYEFILYGNNDGGGSSFTQITSAWKTEYVVAELNYAYLGVAFRKSDNSDISGTTLTNLLIGHYWTAFAKYLSEAEIKEMTSGGQWENKKILWLGTSIPAQGYPQIVGEMLKADVINNAVGASLMRIGRSQYDSSPLGDDLGITGMSHQNVLRSLSMTQEERLRLFLCWKTDDRKAYLMDQGYTAEQVANVVGYSNMLTGEFIEDDTDPTSGAIPAQKPNDVWANNGNTYKTMRQYCYGCCWNNSTDIEGSLSYSGKITGTIKGKLEDYISTVDWIFFDHFRNDATDNTEEQYLTNPTDRDDRHYAIGAFNYLVHQILIRNPNAKILIIGHYDNDDRRYQLGHVYQAQEKAANYWAIPLYKFWEESGIRSITQFTTNGYWDTNHVWHDTGFNGSNDDMTNIEELNLNVRQINGTWYHDISIRQKWMWDETHPMTAASLNHFAKLIAAWLKTKATL